MSVAPIVPEDIKERNAVKIRIRDARPGDWPDVMALLTEVGLVPLDDTAQFDPQFAVAEGPDGAIIGWPGMNGTARTLCHVLLQFQNRIASPASVLG
jgi:hypothetical protein